MSKLIAKIRKSLLVATAAAALLSPALAVAAGETYYWQDSSRQAVVGTGGVFDSTTNVFVGGPPDFGVSAAAPCSAGSGQADLTLAVKDSAYQAKTDPTPASLSASCDTAADPGSVSIYANKAEAQAVSSDKSAPECKGGLLSYIVCPVYDFILGSIKSVENDVIVPFLQINPISTKTNSPPHQIWEQFRNLADIGFIVAFLIIIFAHTLSLGIDSYSLKKTLPRLVMAAVLVQFSYLLVALGVDIANILGGGVQSLVLAPLKGHGTLNVGGINGTVGTIGVAIGISAALTAAGGLVTGTLLVVLIGAFFAIIAVFLTLVARQILVTLFLILSPLAFVAWILPNTEHLFKFWRTSLIRMLLMYPMIVLLFAAGKLFSAAAISTSNGGVGGGTTNALLPLIGVVASVIPLYFIPMTFKYSGSALSGINGWINTLSGGTRKRMESSAGFERFKKRTQQRKTELVAGEQVRGLGAITGNRVTAQILGRGVLNPTGYRSGANVRAMVGFSKASNDWKKRLEEENMGYNGLTYLSRGEAWYKKEYQETADKYEAARAAGNLAEADVHLDTLEKMEEGKKAAMPYFHSSSARAAAALKLSEFDVLDTADREQIIDYSRYSAHQAGKLIGNNVWERAREGARKTNVHLAFTDIKGHLDAENLKKFVSKKPAGAWLDYTKEAVEMMAKDEHHVLQDLASERVTRQILVNTLSGSPGPSIGAEQQKIIEEVLRSVQSPGGVNHDVRGDGDQPQNGDEAE